MAEESRYERGLSASLDQRRVASVLFHPRGAGPARSEAGRQSVRIPVSEGIERGGRLHVASREAPAIVLFQGNGEVATDYESIAPLYTRMGITLLVVDYRGYGDSGGTPTATNLVADAAGVWDHVPRLMDEQGLAPQRLFVMGRSLGCVPAIEIASRRPANLAGLVVESGFALTFPLIARLGGPVLAEADESREGFGNPEKIARVVVPTLLLHGEEDRLIPVSDAELLHAWCGAGEKRLVTMPGAGHNDIFYVGRQTYLKALQDFVLPGTSAIR